MSICKTGRGECRPTFSLSLLFESSSILSVAGPADPSASRARFFPIVTSAVFRQRAWLRGGCLACERAVDFVYSLSPTLHLYTPCALEKFAPDLHAYAPTL